MSTFSYLMIHEQRASELAADAARARLARLLTGRRARRAGHSAAPR